MRLCEWGGDSGSTGRFAVWEAMCGFLPDECDTACSWKLDRIEEDEIANIPSFRDCPVFLPKSDRKENKKPQSKKKDYFAAFLSNRALD